LLFVLPAVAGTAAPCPIGVYAGTHITLAAALGFIHVPTAPVEATIALSIVFLASELARGRSDAGLYSILSVAGGL
jgi:hypothetical protein